PDRIGIVWPPYDVAGDRDLRRYKIDDRGVSDVDLHVALVVGETAGVLPRNRHQGGEATRRKEVVSLNPEMRVNQRGSAKMASPFSRNRPDSPPIMCSPA